MLCTAMRLNKYNTRWQWLKSQFNYIKKIKYLQRKVQLKLEVSIDTRY